MNDILIIDISEGCGPVDYEKVAGQVDGVIFRITEANRLDNYAKLHWDGFGKTGTPRGCYGWQNASDNAAQNVKQAEVFADFFQWTGQLPELGIYGDWESDKKNLTISQMRQAIWKYITVIERELQAILDAYTSAGFWNQQVANSTNGPTDIPKGRALWAANWRVSGPPILPWDWTQRGFSWLLWQYSNRGRVEGINASVDLNRFNGSREDFYKHFNLEPGRPPVEPPPPPEEPPVNPEKIRIAHLLPDETLRMRDGVWGSVVAKTWNDAQFNVSGAQLDSQQRLWYQLGGSVWVASWYAEPVEA